MPFLLYYNVDPEQAGIKWTKNVDRYNKTNNNNNKNIADGDDGIECNVEIS